MLRISLFHNTNVSCYDLHLYSQNFESRITPTESALILDVSWWTEKISKLPEWGIYLALHIYVHIQLSVSQIAYHDKKRTHQFFFIRKITFTPITSPTPSSSGWNILVHTPIISFPTLAGFQPFGSILHTVCGPLDSLIPMYIQEY